MKRLLLACLLTIALGYPLAPAQAEERTLRKLEDTVAMKREWSRNPAATTKPSERGLKNKTILVRLGFRKRMPLNRLCNGSPAFGDYKNQGGSQRFDYSAGWSLDYVTSMTIDGEKMSDPNQSNGGIRGLSAAQARRAISFQCQKNYDNDETPSRVDIVSSTFWFKDTTPDRVTQLRGGLEIRELRDTFGIQITPSTENDIEALASGDAYMIDVKVKLKQHPGYEDIIVCNVKPYRTGNLSGKRDTCKIFAELKSLSIIDSQSGEKVRTWAF